MNYIFQKIAVIVYELRGYSVSLIRRAEPKF